MTSRFWDTPASRTFGSGLPVRTRTPIRPPCTSLRQALREPPDPVLGQEVTDEADPGEHVSPDPHRRDTERPECWATIADREPPHVNGALLVGLARIELATSALSVRPKGTIWKTSNGVQRSDLRR